MKRTKKRLILSLILAGCLTVALLLFIKSDYYSGAQFSGQEAKAKIMLEGNRILCDKNPSIRVDGNRITIYKGGKYQFEGKLDNGQIIVDAGKEEEVTLQLAGVEIHCEDSAPIFVKSADKVRIKLKDDTENILSDGTEYAAVPAGEIMPKACIYSRDDLVIKGEKGTLTVEGNYGNGIHSTDDLKIKSGFITVKARKTALKGKDSVVIEGGDVTLSSERDGIYSGQRVVISGGDVLIQASQYGIYGRKEILVTDSSDVTIKNALSAVAGLGEKRISDSLKIEKDGQD